MLQTYRNRSPHVSVVLPTYNRAAYLDRCIQSVIDQSYADWELVVVDDGSVDQSSLIIHEYAARDERIRSIYHKNMGVSLALNSGILLASGTYVTFINSDDFYRSDHLKRRVLFMETHPKVDLIHGGAEIIGDPHVVDKFNNNKRVNLLQCSLGGTFFGRREVYWSLGGFADVQYSEDSDFMERAEKRFRVRRFDHEPTYVYDRTSPDSICTLLLQKATAPHLQVCTAIP